MVVRFQEISTVSYVNRESISVQTAQEVVGPVLAAAAPAAPAATVV